ncbi:MAG: RDD family protein [Deltaproteobacteria bacterium]|nr:RDD family protein [Deltaproteobacteria bacterium]
MAQRTSVEEFGLTASQSQENDAEGSAFATPAALSPPEREPPLTTPEYAAERDRAGFWLRLVAFVIDLVVLGAFSLLLLLIGFLAANLGANWSGLAPDSPRPFSLLSLWQVAVLTAGAAYFTILHSEQGQTIGKNLLGLEVRTLDGEPLSYGQALVRCLAYGFSAAFLGLGFLWVALNPGKRGWHDLLAGTMVVMSEHREQ